MSQSGSELDLKAAAMSPRSRRGFTAKMSAAAIVEVQSRATLRADALDASTSLSVGTDQRWAQLKAPSG